VDRRALDQILVDSDDLPPPDGLDGFDRSAISQHFFSCFDRGMYGPLTFKLYNLEAIFMYALTFASCFVFDSSISWYTRTEIYIN
jgi:hypothetical protein